MKKELTQDLLKEYLHYNEDTGIFTWIKKPCKKIKVGSVAGSLNKVDMYIEIGLLGCLYKAHRLAWFYVYGEWPERDIDHKDTIKINNCISNLRLSNKSENAFNQGVSKRNTSGFKGVSYIEQSGKWRANAGLNGKIKFLGNFNTPEEASEAYKNFCRKHHGEFIHHSIDG